MIDLLDIFRIAPPFSFGGIEGQLDFTSLVFTSLLANSDLVFEPFTLVDGFTINALLAQGNIDLDAILEFDTLVLEQTFDYNMGIAN